MELLTEHAFEMNKPCVGGCVCPANHSLLINQLPLLNHEFSLLLVLSGKLTQPPLESSHYSPSTLSSFVNIIPRV